MFLDKSKWNFAVNSKGYLSRGYPGGFVGDYCPGGFYLEVFGGGGGGYFVILV